MRFLYTNCVCIKVLEPKKKEKKAIKEHLAYIGSNVYADGYGNASNCDVISRLGYECINYIHRK